MDIHIAARALLYWREEKNNNKIVENIFLFALIFWS